MPLYPINARYLKEKSPQAASAAFWDHGNLDDGQLLLWEGPDGQVVRFVLSLTRFPRPTEYLADWRQGKTLRLGEVDLGDSAPRSAPFKMSPTVQYYRQLDPRVLALLREYFETNAAALDPRQREAISAILRDATRTLPS